MEISFLLLILYVVINSISDLVYKKIYNVTNVVFFVLFLLYFLINEVSILNHFLSMILIFSICLVLYITKIFSGGDLKMLSVLGFFHGYPESLDMFLYAVLLSAIFSIFFLIFKRQFKILIKRYYIFFISIITPGIKINFPKVSESIYVPIGIAIGLSSIIVYTKLTEGLFL